MGVTIPFVQGLVWALALTPIEVVAAPPPSDTAMVTVLVDVSGSMTERQPGWFAASKGLLSDILRGQWTSSGWTVTGDPVLLEVFSEGSPLVVRVATFGTARPSEPYFDFGPFVPMTTGEGTVEGTFPARDEFSQGKTFVRLALAEAAATIPNDSCRSPAFLVVFSDFQQDAAFSRAQRTLVDRHESRVLPWSESQVVTLSWPTDNNVSVRIIELRHSSETRCSTSGTPSFRLTRPVGRVKSGSVTLSWTPVAEAVSYRVTVRPVSGGPERASLTRSDTVAVVSLKEAGEYEVAVQARGAGLEDLATTRRRFTVAAGGDEDSGTPWWPILLGLVALAGVSLFVRWAVGRRNRWNSGRSGT